MAHANISRFRKAFANGSSANVKFSKTQLSNKIQSGGSLADLIGTVPQLMFHLRARAFRKSITLAKIAAPELAEKATEYYINKGINSFDKNLHQVKLQG